MRKDGNETRDRIQSAQTRALLAQTPVAVTAHMFYGLAVVVLLWTRAPHEHLGGWLGVLMLVSVARVILTRYYLRLNPPANEWRRWAAMAVAFITGYGLIWGAASALFLNVSDPVSVVVILSIVVGLYSAAAAITAPYPLSFFGFGATAYLPMIWVLFASGTAMGVALAVIAAAALVTHPLICLNVHRELERSLRLGFENEALRLEAERANAAKTRFLAAASHDLRQPIHALGLSFGTLADRVRNAETQPILDQVEGSIAAVDTMLNALLDISKLDAGVVSPKFEPVPVSVLFRQLENELAPMADEHGNKIRIRRYGALVQSDPAMLQRILWNLLGNALRYTSNGRVLLGARRRGDKLRFEVHDTGIGIPEDRFDDIFVEFQQLGNPQRDRHQGLGLGLAIVKRLAELLRHPIGLSSIPGKGSCFWIEAPLSAAKDTVNMPAQEAPREQLNKLLGARILVLDDELAILQSMRDLLEHWGCKVVTASKIKEATSSARTWRPDLLVVDYRLSEQITGLDAVARLRRVIAAETPALVITGDTAPERLHEAGDSGYPLLYKPVQPARLRSAIQQLLHKRAAEPGVSGVGS